MNMKFNPDHQSENIPKEKYLAGPKLNFEEAEEDPIMTKNRDIFDDPEYVNYLYEPFIEVLERLEKLNKKIKEQEIRLKILEIENVRQNKEIDELNALLKEKNQLIESYFGGIKKVSHKYVEVEKNPEDPKSKKIVRKVLVTEDFKPEDFLSFISKKFDVKTKN